jgi:hypothetical protein
VRPLVVQLAAGGLPQLRTRLAQPFFNYLLLWLRYNHGKPYPVVAAPPRQLSKAKGMAQRRRQAAKTRTVERRTSAAAPYAGYSIQTTRFVHYLLLASRDDAVCLEVFGDVGLEKQDGSRTVEEDKFTISGNPLADRAIPLWKTIRNWVEAIAHERLSPDSTRFIIYATKGNPGAIANAFHCSGDSVKVEDAIVLAAAALKDQRSGELFEHVNAALSNRAILARLLPQLSIQLADDSPIADLRRSFAEELISEDSLDEVMNWTLGWVKRQIDDAISKGMPARITKS